MSTREEAQKLCKEFTLKTMFKTKFCFTRKIMIQEMFPFCVVIQRAKCQSVIKR